MAKWIKDWTDGSGSHSIICREVHGSHAETHNALSGNPQYIARLEISWNDLQTAISRLLGQPSVWPKASHFTLPVVGPVAIDARVINDLAEYGSDADLQIINYNHHALVDVTYIPRNGVYWKLTSNDPSSGGPINQPVYLDDVEEPRIETLPTSSLNFIWGDSTGTPPADKSKALLPGEAPVDFHVGQTLTHSLEGWSGKIDIGQYLGSVHSQSYTSPITQKTYAAGTLMLRNYSIVKSHTFRSYRMLSDPVPTASFYDFGQDVSQTLKLIYEYKNVGWQRFRHFDLGTSGVSYDYMHHAKPPYNVHIPFPPINHNIFFSGTLISLTP